MLSQANPRMPPHPTLADSPQRHLTPWLQSQRHLENVVDSEVSCFSHSENLLNVPAGGTPHPPGRNVTCTKGQCVCVLPRLHPRRAHPVLASRARPRGQGPAQPLLAPRAPRSPAPMQECCTGLLEAWRPVCPQKCLGKAAKLRTSSKHCVNTSFQGEMAALGQTIPPMPNSVLLRPGLGPGAGRLLGHGPAQVTKLREKHPCGLRLVAGDTAQQHPSPRVWSHSGKEPLKVKLLPSELPGLRYRQQCLSPATQPPQVRSNGAFSAQPFCADICSHPLLLGDRPLARPWGLRQSLLLGSAPLELCAALIADRGPPDPGSESTPRSRPGSCPHPAPSAHTVKRPRRTQLLAS
nr:uncharacterized protein LOC131750916 [Kogia breviceps]XP_058909969.1 uncharacterized protein LOC131750916 [Kogia breviceps]